MSITMLSTPVSAQSLTEFLVDSEEITERFDKSLRDATASLIVFTRDDIDKYGATVLSELLERAVGVHNSRSSTGNTSRRVVRGIDGNWLVLYNGLIRDPLLLDTTSILLHDVERVELVKGSHSGIFGQDAVAGTVNLITQAKNGNQNRFGVIGGTQNTGDAWVQYNTKVNNMTLTFSAARHQTEGIDELITADRQATFDQVFGTNASLAPAPGNFNKEVSEARFELSAGSRFFWRNHLYARENGIGVGAAQSLDRDGNETLNRFTSDIEYVHPLVRGDLSIRAGLSFNQAAFNDLRLFPAGTSPLFPDGVFQDIGQETSQFTLSAQYTRKTANNSFTAILGFDSESIDNTFDERNYTVNGGSPLPVPIGETQDLLETDPLFGESTDNTVSLTLRNKWTALRNIKIGTGFRLDNSSLYGNVLNPRLSLEKVLSQDSDLSLLYGESARTPNNTELTANGIFFGLGNPDLEPSKIRMIELVYERRTADVSKLGLNLFAYNHSNTFELVPSDVSRNGLAFENIDEDINGFGIDARLDLALNPSVDLVLGWAFQELDGDTADRARAPIHQPYIELSLNLIRGWSVNTTYSGILGRERNDGDQRPDIDDYHLVNVIVRKKEIFGELDFLLKATNLLDDDAREDVSEVILNDVPVRPRSVFIGLTGKF